VALEAYARFFASSAVAAGSVSACYTRFSLAIFFRLLWISRGFASSGVSSATVFSSVRVIESFTQIILYDRWSIGLPVLYKLFIFQEKVLPTIIFFT